VVLLVLYSLGKFEDIFNLKVFSFFLRSDRQDF